MANGAFFKGKTALVTGASAGLGAVFCRELARSGADVILTARREERLRALKEELESRGGTEARVLPHDLSVPGAGKALWGKVEALGQPVDFLINNAGLGVSGSFAGADLDRTLAMIQLDATSLVELTRLALPGMLERKSGGILIVSSVLGALPTPTFACYGAAKAFVQSFGEALGDELKGSGVHLTVLSPGGIETEFMSVSGHKGSALSRMGAMTPEAVARAGLRGLERNRLCVVPGGMNRAMMESARLMPRAQRLAVARWIQKIAGGAD